MPENEYYYIGSNSEIAQETVQIDQISPRVTHNQPLAPGYLNDAEV